MSRSTRSRLSRRFRTAAHAASEPAAPRLRRRLLAAVCVLATVAVGVPAAVRAGTPGSDPANGSWVGGKIVQPGPELLVLWKLPGSGGVLGTCIDARLAGPLTGPYAPTATIADSVYGELNHLYAAATTSDVRLAELSALNSRKYDRVDRAEQWSYIVNGAGGTSVADAEAMLARATTLAGPYTVTIGVPSGELAPGSTHDATVTVRAARGAGVPGAKVSLSATGATLSTTTVTTSSTGRATVRFRVAATGSATFVLRGSVQSWTSVRVYAAPGEQQMLTVAPPSTQRGAVTGRVQRDRLVDLIKVDHADPAHTPVPGYTYRISEAASGKVVVPSVVSATTASAAPVGRLALGTRYLATELSAPSGGPLYIPADRSFDFTVPAGSGTWTLVARDPRIPTPAIVTRVNAETALVGLPLSDTVTVSGNDGEDGTIIATRYGPVRPPATHDCSDLTLTQYFAARSQTFSATVDGSVNSGNGEFVVDGGAVQAAGCYGWAEVLTLTLSGATATSPPTAPNESTLVSTPEVTTTPTVRAPAVAPPAHRPGRSRPPAVSPPALTPPTPLAATGARIPVRATATAGCGLILVGILVLAAARRRKPTA